MNQNIVRENSTYNVIVLVGGRKLNDSDQQWSEQQPAMHLNYNFSVLLSSKL